MSLWSKLFGKSGEAKGNVAPVQVKSDEAKRLNDTEGLLSSGLIGKFVAKTKANWNHQKWLEFLATVRKAGYGSLSDDEIGRLLEEEKATYKTREKEKIGKEIKADASPTVSDMKNAFLALFSRGLLFAVICFWLSFGIITWRLVRSPDLYSPDGHYCRICGKAASSSVMYSGHGFEVHHYCRDHYDAPETITVSEGVDIIGLFEIMSPFVKFLIESLVFGIWLIRGKIIDIRKGFEYPRVYLWCAYGVFLLFWPLFCFHVAGVLLTLGTLFVMPSLLKRYLYD